MVKPRDYKAEYKDFHGKPAEIAKRAERNAARAKVKKKLGAAAVAGKDVHHKKAIRHGGGNGDGNLAVTGTHHRGWEREGR
jgi:hypothetical protein